MHDSSLASNAVCVCVFTFATGGGEARCCFNMTLPLSRELGTGKKRKKGFPSLVWKNLTGPHRALTPSPSNTFGTKWKADRGLITPSSVLDLTNATEWEPDSKSWGGGHLTRRVFLHALPLHICAVLRCLYTFDDIVYVTCCVLFVKITVDVMSPYNMW